VTIKNRAILETQRLALSDKNKNYIYKSFIYITREVFVRHTVSRNLQMSDTRDPYYLLILTRHVVPKLIGKVGQKKTQQILGP
jgi:hypothetical protein